MKPRKFYKVVFESEPNILWSATAPAQCSARVQYCVGKIVKPKAKAPNKFLFVFGTLGSARMFSSNYHRRAIYECKVTNPNRRRMVFSGDRKEAKFLLATNFPSDTWFVDTVELVERVS